MIEQTEKPEANPPRRIAYTEAPGLSVEVFQAATGEYFMHAEFSTGMNYYSPIFRDEAIVSADAARKAHHAFVKDELQRNQQEDRPVFSTGPQKQDVPQTHAWRCLSCGERNTDTRASFVICTECGRTYEKAPTGNDHAAQEQEWTNRAELIVRGTQDPASGWHNSPDDLVIVIASELRAAFTIGQKSVKP